MGPRSGVFPSRIPPVQGDCSTEPESFAYRFATTWRPDTKKQRKRRKEKKSGNDANIPASLMSNHKLEKGTREGPEGYPVFGSQPRITSNVVTTRTGISFNSRHIALQPKRDSEAHPNHTFFNIPNLTLTQNTDIAFSSTRPAAEPVTLLCAVEVAWSF